MSVINVVMEKLPVQTKSQILDIGGGALQSFNKTLLEKKLFWTKEPFTTLSGHTQRVLPTSVIYGTKGLDLWAKITHLPSYYQTDGEAALFIDNAHRLAQWIQKDSIMVDLGCGDIRKLIPLMNELQRLEKSVLYCPLDLSRKSIEEALKQTNLSDMPCISVTGLWGTFDDGIHWANRHCGDRPKIFMSLGSMLGNDHFEDAVARLRWLRQTSLRTANDMILLTMDGTKDADKIKESYDDVKGLFTRFILQGFEDSNTISGEDWYRPEDWTLQRRLTRDPTMHRFVLHAKHAAASSTKNFDIREGDEIDCYEGFKYGPEEMAKQYEAAGLRVYAQWKGPHDDIYQYLLGSAEFPMPRVPKAFQTASGP